MQDLAASIEKHYSEWTGFEAVLENLKRKGIDLAKVRAQDVYPYDQAHAGGVEATAKLAQLAAIEPHAVVVDVGCGIGGAARYLHAEFFCRVVGVDLTPARLRAGMELNHLVGFVEGIDLLAAQADAMPLPAGYAAVIWIQHVMMNIPNHRSFVRECSRILNPAGRLALHEWFLRHPESSSTPLSYPLPWAPNPMLNHAVSSEEFLKILERERFVPAVEDVTAAMIARLRKDNQALASRGAPRQRLAAHENLVKAASDGVLHCLMITAAKQESEVKRGTCKIREHLRPEGAATKQPRAERSDALG